jgi:hypothetical protein
MNKILLILIFILIISCQNRDNYKISLLIQNDWIINSAIINNTKLNDYELSLIEKNKIFKVSFTNLTCYQRNKRDDENYNKMKNIKISKQEKKHQDSISREVCNKFMAKDNEPQYYCCTYRDCLEDIGCYYRISGEHLEILKCGSNYLSYSFVPDELDKIWDKISRIVFKQNMFSVSKESFSMSDSLGNFILFKPIKKAQKL